VPRGTAQTNNGTLEKKLRRFYNARHLSPNDEKLRVQFNLQVSSVKDAEREIGKINDKEEQWQ